MAESKVKSIIAIQSKKKFEEAAFVTAKSWNKAKPWQTWKIYAKRSLKPNYNLLVHDYWMKIQTQKCDAMDWNLLKQMEKKKANVSFILKVLHQRVIGRWRSCLWKWSYHWSSKKQYKWLKDPKTSTPWFILIRAYRQIELKHQDVSRCYAGMTKTHLFVADMFRVHGETRGESFSRFKSPGGSTLIDVRTREDRNKPCLDSVRWNRKSPSRCI